MRWLLIDVGFILVTLALLGLLAFRLYGKVRQVNGEIGGLRNRLTGLTDETTALAARLDAAEVTARLGERAAN